ncbi:MAG: alpha-amylase [Ignavibacteria bacterium]
MAQTFELRLHSTGHPIVYEVNTRVLMNELSQQSGTPLRLDQIPDTLLDEWQQLGFDAIWLMGIWSPSKRSREIARTHEGLREEYRRALPDVTDEDIGGSPYAVGAYTVARSLGGARSLSALRRKLARRGMGLILDFVSNHTARDHPWVSAHPEYYINGRNGEETEKPGEFFRTRTTKGFRTIAFGRDPHFPSWTDTAQLNPYLPAARTAMIDTLQKIARMCDGVRCDMAMLLLREVFMRTWGAYAASPEQEPLRTEFWEEAIQSVLPQYPQFLFIAEAYWNLEWELQQLGFRATYDKTLYDRLLHEGAGSVYDHLRAELIYQQRCVRFIENHDEHRIAYLMPNEWWHYAAATIAATIPGMLLLHEGQLDGRRVKVPVQLLRRPHEDLSIPTKAFYTKLLSCLHAEIFRRGNWQLLYSKSAWYGNNSHLNIIPYMWRMENDCRFIVVNYAPHNSQCYVELHLDSLDGRTFEFRDLMSPAVYVRDRETLEHKGMYFDLPGYGFHIFTVTPAHTL